MPPEPSTSQPKEGWLSLLHDAPQKNQVHFWGKHPAQLITQSPIDPANFTVGNGADIYDSKILPLLQTAQREITFVTCFWARSICLTKLGQCLVALSERGKSRPDGALKLRVRICLSSRSLLQKLSHTSSPNGYVYKTHEWASKLGLPAPEALSGLDLQIKSLFFLPFSVMHPKFVIVDRQYALLPSCNLSYESWFEGCLHLTGPIVAQLLLFWQETWGRNDLPPLPLDAFPIQASPTEASSPTHTTMLLPSPHHRSPHFRPFLATPEPPRTPLNIYLAHLVSNAKSSIRILTPNLTCQYVISLLLNALARGVDVKIITNRCMMVLEQLLTAGTVTELCVCSLRRRWRKLVASVQTAGNGNDRERGHPAPRIGCLSIGYFRPGGKYAKSHLKCTILDNETVVLGSGNMDRASWYTSQELGVAIEGGDVVREIWRRVEGEWNGKGGVEWV